MDWPAAAAAASLRLFLMATGCTEEVAGRFSDSAGTAAAPAAAASPAFSSSSKATNARAAVTSALLFRALVWWLGPAAAGATEPVGWKITMGLM